MSTTVSRDIASRAKLAIAQDTFIRVNASSWGAASDGINTWTNIAGTAADFTIVSNEGQFTGSTALNIMALGTGTIADCEVLVRLTSTAVADNVGVMVRGDGTANNWLRFRTKAGTAFITKTVSGTVTDLASATFNTTASVYYWLRVRVTGSSLFFRLWTDGTTEPTSWTVSVTDASITGAGRFGLFAVMTATTHVVTYDHFVLTDASPSRRDIPTRARIAAVSVRDLATRFRLQTTGSRDLATRFILSSGVQNLVDIGTRLVLGVTQKKDMSERFRLCFAQDTFTRANTTASTVIATGWGSPSDNPVNGDTWSVTGGGTMTWQVVGNEGTATGTTSNMYARLGPGLLSDTEVLTRLSLTNAADAAGVFARFASVNNHYRMKVTNTGFTLIRVVASVVTTMATFSSTVTAGSFYWIRFRVAGNQVMGKIWASGSAEPSGWNAVVTDGSLTTAGRFGLFMQLGGTTSSFAASFDSLVVLGAPTPYHDIATRIRVAALISRDLASRLVLYGVRLRDIGSRVKLAAAPKRDIGTRLVLAIGTIVGRDSATRVNMAISQDTFGRAPTAGSSTISDVISWGFPSDSIVNGDTWSSKGAAAFSWGINAVGQGVMTSASTGNTYALLGSNQLANVEALIQFTTSQVLDAAGVVVRYVNVNNHYRFRYANGAIGIILFLGGTSITLASLPIVYSPGVMYNLRARVVGTNLLARVWPNDGSAEPLAWTVTASDSTFSTGQYGLFMKTNTAGDTVTFDDVVFYDGAAVNSPLRDLFSRFKLQASKSRDLATRLVLGIANNQKDLATRIKVNAQRLRDIGSRYRLQAVGSRDIGTRFTVQIVQAVVRAQDLACRFILGGPPIAFTPTPPPPFAGVADVVPLRQFPNKPYAVNGTVLDTQPLVMTAPVATFNILQAGTSFTLVFTNPSTNTQNLLQNGSTVSMQFGLADGSVATGQVQLASVLTGTTLAVNVTLTQSITINQWVVTTQFL